MICQVVEPMALAASMTPPSTSRKLCSTTRAMYGVALMTSGNTEAEVPMAVPITARVTGISMAISRIKGMERRKLITAPSTALKVGAGLMPSFRVITSSTPRGMPSR